MKSPTINMSFAVSFFSTGANGSAGPKGDVGSAGLPGAVGPKGDTGAAGVAGPTGSSGLSCWDVNANGKADDKEDVNGDKKVDALDCAGPKGATGANGPAGAAGVKGDAGPAGAIGPIGLPGATGPKGDTGPAGAKGDAGPTGVAGPKGDNGAAGAVGPAGPAGIVDVVYITKTSALDATMVKEVEAICPANSKVIGGGAQVTSTVGVATMLVPLSASTPVSISRDTRITLQETFPLPDKGWHITAVSQSACNCEKYAWQVTAWAVCLELPKK